MKKVALFFTGIILFTSCSNSGNNLTADKKTDSSSSAENKNSDNPSDAVTKGFAAKFPNATKVKWGKENATEWEAEFNLNGTDESANFSAEGAWLETEAQIKEADLPKAVKDAIDKNYGGWTITEADKTETAKNGTIYEADLKNGNDKKAVAFKEDGTPVTE